MARYWVINTTTAVTITDDDTLSTNWTLSAAPNSMAEGSGTTEITVTATRSGTTTSTTPTTVAIAVAGSTATAGTDFSPVTGFNISVPAGATSGEATFDLVVTNDTLDEIDETISITGTLQGNSFTPATLTITDNDDAPTLAIIAPAAVTEGDSGSSDMVFTVTLTPASGKQVTVDYAVDTTSTASSVGDFTDLSSSTLTFNPGDTSKTIIISVTGDELDENDETIVLKLSNATNASIITATATGTITDDDASPVLSALSNVNKKMGQSVSITAEATDADGDILTYSWSKTSGPDLPNGTNLNAATLTFTPTQTVTYAMTVIASDGNGNTDTEDVSIIVAAADTLSVAESDGNAEVTISATQAFGKSISFKVTYGGNSATGASDPADGDYDNKHITSITFQSTDTSKTISIPITDDNLDESNETFTVNIALANGSTLPSGFVLGNATTTVTITDDDTLSTNWSLSAAPNSVTEASGTTEITVTATRSGTATSTTPTTVAIAVPGDTATAGTDFSPVTGFNISIPAGETSAEETFDLVVTNGTLDETDETISITGTLQDNSFAPATLTITDNDDAPALAIAAPAAVTEGDSGSSDMVFTVTLTPASGKQVTVDYAVDSTSTATADTDFTDLPSATLTFAAGDTSKTITVSVTGDDLDENDETIVLKLSNATNASIASATASGTITDDDDSAPSLSIATPAAVTEGDSGSTDMVFTVTIAPASGQQVTVDYAVDSTSTATSASDFTALSSSTLTFEAGDISKSLTVSVTGDELDEPDETVVLKLSDAANASIATATATGNITDDDASPVLATISNVNKKLGPSVSITAEATDADGDTVTYTWSKNSGPDLSDGINLNAATLTFTPTQTGTYAMTVTASDGNGNIDTEDVSIIVAVADTVSVPSTLSVAENAGNAEITVSTTQAFGKSIAFNVTYGDNSATGASDPANGDYGNGQITTVTFQSTDTSKTISIPITDDNLDESNETFTVNIALANGSTLPDGFVLGNATTTVTITDDDTPSTNWTLTADPNSVAEDSGTTEVTATRSGSTTATTPVTIAIAVAGGTATAGNDFSQVTGFNLSVPAGATSGEATFDLVVTNDTLDETDETISITDTLQGNSLTPATLTITNNDQATEDAPQAESRKEELAGTSLTTLAIATDMIGTRVGGDLSGSGGGGSMGDQALGILQNLLWSSNGSQFSSDLSLAEIGEQLWSQSFHISQSDSAQQDWQVTGEQQGSWSLWGAGELRSFKGNDDSDAEQLSYSGSVKAAWLGIDYQFTDAWLGGVAVAFSSGESDYSYQSSETGTAGSGSTKTWLTAFYRSLHTIMPKRSQPHPSHEVYCPVSIQSQFPMSSQAISKARLRLLVSWPLVVEKSVVEVVAEGFGTIVCKPLKD